LSVIELPARASPITGNAFEDSSPLADGWNATTLLMPPPFADHVAVVGPSGGSGSPGSDPSGVPPANRSDVRPDLLDALIIPLAAWAFAVKTMFRSLLRLLVNVLDWIFPIVMHGARIPLFLTRIVGDVIAAGLSALMWLLPLSATRRRELQAVIARGWGRLRKHISYRAFEEALHHTFERGMTFVFRTCRDLSPRSALLVICAAAAWFPITFGTSTVMHAFLLANATTLPAWMQIFHFPVALMAKSKILVLPVYPAAWPQAKRHWFVRRVQDVLRAFNRFAAVRRLALRYRQTELAADQLGRVMIDVVVSAGPYRAAATALRSSREAAAFCAGRFRRSAWRVTASASRLWLIGPYLRNLLARFSRTAPLRTTKPSERIRLVYKRWSVKFTPGYYEGKERQIVHSAP
jgi:transposase